MKECFKCGIKKPLSEYYKHKQMLDGFLNKCKVCTKVDVSKHRLKNIEKIRAYDRARGSRQSCNYLRDYRAKYPRKYKSHMLVKKAIRTGKLYKENCSSCGSTNNTHAHHDDYSKPLNIRWLCPVCHSQHHAKYGEALNP